MSACLACVAPTKGNKSEGKTRRKEQKGYQVDEATEVVGGDGEIKHGGG